MNRGGTVVGVQGEKMLDVEVIKKIIEVLVMIEHLVVIGIIVITEMIIGPPEMTGVHDTIGKATVVTDTKGDEMSESKLSGKSGYELIDSNVVRACGLGLSFRVFVADLLECQGCFCASLS